MIIYKYPLAVAEINELHVPVNSSILDIQDQNGIMCVWMRIQDEHETVTERRRFRIIGTGHAYTPTKRMTHVKSVQLRGFIWHVFEEHR